MSLSVLCLLPVCFVLLWFNDWFAGNAAISIDLNGVKETNRTSGNPVFNSTSVVVFGALLSIKNARAKTSCNTQTKIPGDRGYVCKDIILCYSIIFYIKTINIQVYKQVLNLTETTYAFRLFIPSRTTFVNSLICICMLDTWRIIRDLNDKAKGRIEGCVSKFQLKREDNRVVRPLNFNSSTPSEACGFKSKYVHKKVDMYLHWNVYSWISHP